MNNFHKKKLLILCIALGIFAGFFIKFFLIDIYHISGKSMEPTLKDGSKVAVSKIAYGLLIPFTQNFLIKWSEPKKDDIVIFLHENKIVIKRCVAVGGDKLDFLINSQYTLSLGETKIPISKEQFKNLSQFSQVPQGYIMAIGDNYDYSIDSRDYGFISTKNIMGKVIKK